MQAERRAKVPGAPDWTYCHRHRRETDFGSIFGGGVVLLGLLGFGMFETAERFPEYFGAVVAATSLRTIESQVSHVRDDDTIEEEGVPNRFGSLDRAEWNTLEGQRATARMRRLTQQAGCVDQGDGMAPVALAAIPVEGCAQNGDKTARGGGAGHADAGLDREKGRGEPPPRGALSADPLRFRAVGG